MTPKAEAVGPTSAEALAALVTEPTPENVIPWSLDRRVPEAVSKATAEAWV